MGSIAIPSTFEQRYNTAADRNFLIPFLAVSIGGAIQTAGVHAGVFVLIVRGELGDEDLLNVTERVEACLDNLKVVAKEQRIVTGRIVTGLGRTGQRFGLCFFKGIEDGKDGADEVELDNGAPEDLFFAKCLGRVM